MMIARALRKASFLVAVLLLATTIGAQPVYAVDSPDTNAKKTDKQKSDSQVNKEKKPREKTPPPAVDDPRLTGSPQGY